MERIVQTEYQVNHQRVVVRTKPVDDGQNGEDILDTSSLEGAVNFATTMYPDAQIQHVLIINDKTHQSRTFDVPSELITPEGSLPVYSQKPEDVVTAMTRIHVPPRGVRIDHGIRPRAGLGASHRAKADAVLAVARSKLGTPYIWGHNEDRGQYGFDCSNFTEYVYHHALGYRFTTASRGQYLHVGDPVHDSQRSIGDLIVFERGAHVGIYVGNNRFINCGGGLGKVGYLSMGPGSYWGKHITSYRRMF
ncbi:C40 family peptidase [Alicyclobacillus tolerans]|uniref:C40 family peptidase n=1 Tax=Alicyclobacillus tolerans TaxID=90970 RepID=UPI001F2F97C5|nr:C40 family peptidase [Alicyclobacillus tolerans]MCF8567386.1 C40 family peptidase [Alicyclobacillus tolerans]